MCALLFLCATALNAQEADQQAKRTDNGVHVIVTADRMEESELTTPAHITVISEDQITTSGEQSLVSILEKLAGINFNSYSGPQQAQIDMRGFGENSHGRVLVMVDGRRLNSQDMSGLQWLSIPLESITRIEVVHGSNSVMYGNHAVAGVLNIITKDSKEPAEFASTIDFGSYYSDESSNNLYSSQRIRYGTRQGTTDGSVTFSHSTNEGHRERTAERSVNTLLNGGWDITEILRTELDFGYQWNTYEMPGPLSKAQYESDPSQADNDADEAEEHDLTSYLSFEWFPFYNTELSIDGGYRYQAQAYDTPSDFTPHYTDRVYHTLEGSPQVVVEGHTGPFPWHLISGFDVYHSTQEIVEFADKDRTNKNFTSELTLTSYGVFVKPHIELTEEVNAEAGIRYETARIAGKKEVADLDESDRHQAFVYDGGLNYQPLDNLKIYMKGGTLFRYPFTDEQASVAGFQDGFNSDLEPEKGMNAEIGTKLVFQNKLNFALNGYYLQMEDEIAWYDPDGFGPTPGQNVNRDTSRRWGIDSELGIVLHKMLSAHAAYSFVDARFTEGENEDNHIPLVPTHTVDARITFRPLKTITITPEAQYTSEQYQSGDNSNSMDPIEEYWLFDIEAGYSPDIGTGEMHIKIRVKNLLDELYATYATYDYYYPAPGRSISISASYSY